MIFPIVAYGDPVLKKKATPIDKKHPNLKQLISDMWETMYAANGVGLAAPQIGESIRLFVVDGSPFIDNPNLDPVEKKDLAGFKKVFINPEIHTYSGPLESFSEGCLSIPDIHGEVSRASTIGISYYNENFELIEEEISGLSARIVQHEYDHVEGILFIDKLGSLKRKLLKTKLSQISRGNISPGYDMRFPNKTNAR